MPELGEPAETEFNYCSSAGQLSRIDPPTSVKALVASKPRFGTRMTVDSVILYRSRLGGGPARYEEVARFPLSGAG